MEHEPSLATTHLPEQAQQVLTRDWAQSSPVHPGDSPRSAARPPDPGPRSAWASLSSRAHFCLPEGCYSPGCHSEDSEPQAAGGLSWPHLGRGRKKGCSSLSPLGTQSQRVRLPRDPILPAGKPGELCCTAFSSSSRRSSSDKLLPREELIIAGEGSADFCLLGKLGGKGKTMLRCSPALMTPKFSRKIKGWRQQSPQQEDGGWGKDVVKEGEEGSLASIPQL